MTQCAMPPRRLQKSKTHLPEDAPRPSLPRGGRLVDQAYYHTKTLLLDGRLKPGQRVSVEALVATIGASRQPIMEALKRLAAEGFLEIIPQVGCRVVVPEPRTMFDFFRLFAAAEGLCAELAAERRNDRELIELQTVSAQIGALPSAKMPDERRALLYREWNRAFHSKVHEMAHSDTIVPVAQGFWDRSDFYISNAIGSMLFATRLKEAQTEHDKVLRAIHRQDGATARRAMEEHIRAFGDRAAATFVTPERRQRRTSAT